MRHQRFVAYSVAVLGTFWHVSAAHAWLAFCNNSADEVQVAIGYLDKNDNRNPAFDRGWVAEGWYKLSPGQCSTLYPHELWRRNRYYYYYAKSPRGHWGGGLGSSSMCVSHNRMSIHQNDEVKRQCSRGTVTYSYTPPSRGCSGPDSCLAVMPSPVRVTIESTYWEQFARVDIGGGNVQNHTVNLTQ